MLFENVKDCFAPLVMTILLLYYLRIALFVIVASLNDSSLTEKNMASIHPSGR